MECSIDPFLRHLVDLEVCSAKSVPGRADALHCS